jgi:hypothetical protein
VEERGLNVDHTTGRGGMHGAKQRAASGEEYQD